MDENKSHNPRQMLNVAVRKSNYADGVDGAVVWKDEASREISRTMQSLPREIMLAIIGHDRLHAASWQSYEELELEHPDLDADQLESIYKVNNDAAAKELRDMKAGTITAYASLYNMLGQSSLDVLMADPEFRANDRGARCPLTFWRRYICTHITEREGKGTLRSLVATKQLLSIFASMQQTQTESLTDFFERFERTVKALKQGGIDISAAWLCDEEKQTGFFLYCLCAARYGGLIRDISNGILVCPNTIVELIKIAKDRKESKANFVPRAKVMIMGENSGDRGPLEPYPFISSSEYGAMSSEEKTKLQTHNDAIAQAGSKLAKMGWRDGRFRKNPSQKTPDKKPAYDASKKKVSPTVKRRDKEKKVMMAATVESESEHEQEIVLATDSIELVELHSDISEYEYSDGDTSMFTDYVGQSHCLTLSETIVTELPDDDVPELVDSDESSDEDGTTRDAGYNAGLTPTQVEHLFATLPRNANSPTLEGQFSAISFAPANTEECDATSIPDLLSDDSSSEDEDPDSPPHLLTDESSDESDVEVRALVTNPVELVEILDSPARHVEARTDASSGVPRVDAPPGVQDLTSSPDRDQGCEEPPVRRGMSTPIHLFGSIGYRSRADAIASRQREDRGAVAMHPTSPNHESPSSRSFTHWVITTGPRTGEIFTMYSKCQEAMKRKGRLPGGICKGFHSHEDAMTQSDMVTMRGARHEPSLGSTIGAENTHSGGCRDEHQGEIRNGPLGNPHASTPSSHEDHDVGSRPTIKPHAPTPREDSYVALDESIPALPRSSIIVIDSMYRGVNAAMRVAKIGRGISSDTMLVPGQEIATFNGTRVSRAVAAALSIERRSYMLDLVEDCLADTSGDLEFPILDCYDEATRAVTGCVASMSNTAAGLYDRNLDTTLEREDNNAAVKILERDGTIVAVLYSISIVSPGQEILWDYGNSDEEDESSTYSQSDSSDSEGDHSQDAPSTGPSSNMQRLGLDGMSTATGPASDAGAAMSRMHSLTRGNSRMTPGSGTGQHRCLAVGPDSFHPDYALLDSASGTNLCKAESHAMSVKECVRGMISGIEGDSQGISYHQSCLFVDPELGRMPFSPGASANIISLAVARDKGFVADYCNDSDEFTLMSPSGSRYTFGRLPKSTGPPCKFYVMSLHTSLPPSSEETRILCAIHQHDAEAECPIDEHDDIGCHVSMAASSPISTVKGNQQKYTKEQNRQAVDAQEYLAAMGFPSLSVAIAQTRGMRNCPVSEQSIKRAFDIFGVPVQRIKGSTKKRNDPPARPELGVTTVQKEQIAEVDLFFVRGLVFILCILTPLEYSFCLHTKDKSTDNIMKALEAILAESESRGFKVE